MSFTHKFTQSYTTASGGLSKDISATDDAQDERDITVPTTSTVGVDLDVVANNLKGFYMESDVALTVLLKLDGSTVQTINLAANVPVCWIYGSAAECPITSDFDSLTAQNESETGAASLKIRVLQHSAS